MTFLYINDTLTINTKLTRRVHALQETEFFGYWRVDFWYLKMKPSAHISVKWALFL